jgi:hypothetical protein
MALGNTGDFSVIGQVSTGANQCFANTGSSYGAVAGTAGTKFRMWGATGTSADICIGVATGELWSNAGNGGDHTFYNNGTLVAGIDHTGYAAGTRFNTSYLEYRTYTNDFGTSGAYLYPALSVTNGGDIKKVLSTTCSFVAKSGYVRVKINGNVWPNTGYISTSTIGVFLALGTNSAGSTFIYPVGVGSSATGFTQMGSIMLGSAQTTWDGVYNVTAGVTYWPVVRFVAYFAGTVNVQVSLCTIEHINALT